MLGFTLLSDEYNLNPYNIYERVPVAMFKMIYVQKIPLNKALKSYMTEVRKTCTEGQAGILLDFIFDQTRFESYIDR